MRKLFIVFGIIAVAVIAAAWSISTLPPKAHKTAAIHDSGGLSPHDLMVIKGKTLPSEQWDAF